MRTKPFGGQGMQRWLPWPAIVLVLATSAVLLLPFSTAVPSGDKPLPSPTRGVIDFVRDVRPLLEERCVACHGPAKQRGGLRLDSAAAVLRGGDSGDVVQAGRSAESLLIHHVAGVAGASRMPPKGDPLTGEQIGVLRAWIDQGAKGPSAATPSTKPSLATGLWSLLPIKRSAVPATPAEYRGWVRNPVDAFVLQKLLAHGMSPSPQADRRTLLRRLSLDLTGLPPMPGEIDTFVGDTSPNAYEKLVDRLLASSRYGERWARHWLDVAHYADSHGNEHDTPRPNAWPYRDYLIRSLNMDKPYDRFVREQVAGDVLLPEDPEAIRATGFLAAGPWDESQVVSVFEGQREIGRYLDRDDIVTTTMSSFVGLTVGCARCHDHKFDPISQDDYYALQAVFAATDKAERTFEYDDAPAVARKRQHLQRLLAQVRGWREKVEPVLLSPERQAEVVAFETAWQAAEKRWVVPELILWRSKRGTILKPLLDRSILSLGPRPNKDTYTVTVGTDLVGMTGLRLEFLCDETLPLNGPGRNKDGNLHLSEVRVTACPKGKGGPIVPVRLKAAVADFSQGESGITKGYRRQVGNRLEHPSCRRQTPPSNVCVR
jgi:mono/diheme cytochrome c family protein